MLTTSEGKELDRLLCFDAGCDLFLTKPLDGKVFLEAAHALLPALRRWDTPVNCHINAKCRAFDATLSAASPD